jgi:hypothetical protein
VDVVPGNGGALPRRRYEDAVHGEANMMLLFDTGCPFSRGFGMIQADSEFTKAL